MAVSSVETGMSGSMRVKKYFYWDSLFEQWVEGGALPDTELKGVKGKRLSAYFGF